MVSLFYLNISNISEDISLLIINFVYGEKYIFKMTIGSPMLWLPAHRRMWRRRGIVIVVLFPKVGKCNQTNDTYTFKQSKILQISLQLR